MIIWWVFYLFARKWTTHPLSPGYVASKYRWPGLHAQKRWSRICCIHHCKVTPMYFDVGDDNHKNANSQLQVVLPLKLRSELVCQICVGLFWRHIGNRSNGNRSIWARWFALRVSLRSWSFPLQMTAVGFTRVWPNSQHPNDQQANKNMIKACIVNESDGFIQVCSTARLHRKWTRKQSNNLNSSRILGYKDLNVLNVLVVLRP
jgi:hypothetical protein